MKLIIDTAEKVASLAADHYTEVLAQKLSLIHI